MSKLEIVCISLYDGHTFNFSEVMVTLKLPNTVCDVLIIKPGNLSTFCKVDHENFIIPSNLRIPCNAAIYGGNEIRKIKNTNFTSNLYNTT